MSRKDDVKSRILVIRTTSPRNKIFATRQLLSGNLEKYSRRSDLVEDPEGSEGLSLATRLFDIDGVDSVFIDQYDVQVKIAHAYDWSLDSIESKVILTLRNYIETCNMLEKISNKKFRKKPESGK